MGSRLEASVPHSKHDDGGDGGVDEHEHGDDDGGLHDSS